MKMNRMSPEERDAFLKSQLSPEKVKIIEKFGLSSNKKSEWISEKENAHPHLIFKQSFALKTDLIRLLFRVFGLCAAKVTYFRNNMDHFECYIHNYKWGFIKCELWNAEFFKHKAGGFMIDIRELQKITRIEDFRELCAYLESFEKK